MSNDRELRYANFTKYMRSEPLPTLSEMVEFGKKVWGYNDMTQEDRFP